ncbi:MAG: hypothetical protein K2L52_06130 [Clostridia bacterium]|nr:hypothetical protein [Clostridia bacterium]
MKFLLGTAIEEEDLKLIYDSPTNIVKIIDGKWEVDFSGKIILLRRDEIELVGDYAVKK